MYEFKTFGQLNLDLIFKGFDRMPGLGEEVYADQFSMQLGGGATVLAVVLQSLGCQVKLGTFLGEDEVSHLCRRLLAKQGLDGVDNFPSPRPDPVVVTSVFSWPHDRSFLSYSSRVSEDCLDEETVFSFLRDAKIAFAPAGHPAVIRRLHEAGVKLVYDSGWSDDLSIDSLAPFLPYLDLYTPNDKEALHLAGVDNVEAAVHFLAQYTPCPVVTMGRRGCAYLDGDTVRILPPAADFDAVDATGAGDNFLAGVVCGLVQGKPLEQALRIGSICGGYSTTGVGCFGAVITPEILAQYLSI